MKIMILGADGYLGWPTVLHFMDRGHEVIAIDNYSKRELLNKFNCPSLLPSVPLWESAMIHSFALEECNIAYGGFLYEAIKKHNPKVIIHYAEQPSAPYSMLSYDAAYDTVRNNVMGTLNLIHAINKVNPDIHLIKFGSMGEYGTPNIDIEEGWLSVKHKGRREKFLYPRIPGSLYHTTKVYDTDMLWFYAKQWGLKVSDIMQGVVYGVTTPEIEKYEMPTNFYYDEMFGTVINRFIVQAMIGHPLTIYGEGTQQRTFLNLKDVLQCLDLVIQHPPIAGNMDIINQFTDKFSIKQLAILIREVANEFGLDPKIEYKKNLRQEKTIHYYNPISQKLAHWGLKPCLLDVEGIRAMFQALLPYKDKVNKDIIYKGIEWKK